MPTAPAPTAFDPVIISDLDLSSRVDVGSERTACGGYSDVFPGTLHGESSKVKVAVKELRLTAIKNEDRLKKRFFREIVLWRTLQHPTVVPLSGYMMRSGLYSLISPWYSYGNVTQYLKTCTNPNRASLAIDVARGLKYLHSISVAHGDLKGENVLIDSNHRASLCDFGMSQFLDEACRISGFTTSTAGGTTGRFASPEILEDKPKSSATDIWAFGCLVVQILTDQIPYQDVSGKLALPVAIMRGQPPMTNAHQIIDELLWNDVSRCWNIVPEDRPCVSHLELRLLSAALRGLVPWIEIPIAPHRGVVDMQFSPDGSLLAAIVIGESDDDRCLVIWGVEQGGLTMRQVVWCSVTSLSWSPSGVHLLCVCPTHVEIRHALNVIERHPVTYGQNKQIFAAVWLHDEAIAYVDDSDIAIQRLKGGTELSRINSPITIRGLAFSSASQRMAIVGSSSGDGLQWIMYSFKASVDNGSLQREGRALLWHEPIGVSVTGEGDHALVAYSGSPPQLWNLEPGGQDLKLVHTYNTTTHANLLWRSAQFGGVGDMFVIGVTNDGDIHFWNRESASHLHVIAALAPEPGPTTICWNYGQALSPAFATITRDRPLTIWSTRNLTSGQANSQVAETSSGEQMKT
ncbi:hypothetical protein FRC03_012790 [Tulasnella sp. 419]|nr:hypothetical protein FRC03_012790 [Tulasnella sp. 419]